MMALDDHIGRKVRIFYSSKDPVCVGELLYVTHGEYGVVGIECELGWRQYPLFSTERSGGVEKIFCWREKIYQRSLISDVQQLTIFDGRPSFGPS